MASIDRYLLHAFDAVENEIRSEAEARGGPEPGIIRLPMLIQVRGTSWNPNRVPDCTVTAQLGNIVACLGSLRTVAALQDDPTVLAVEAGRPPSSLDTSQSVPFVKANVVHGRTPPETGDQALIAIIDEDIDVLHEAFRDKSGDTRILAVWDQTDPTGPSPSFGGQGGYGTEHTESQINQYIQSGNVPSGLQRVTNGHGTFVASVAAGRSTGSQFSGGVAPDARIIVVIPSMQVGPTDPYSLGYSISLTAALAYIDDLAQRHNLPVVVNLSQGMNAGAHDGTSLVEAYFDNFTEGGRLPGRVVVKSAGNERAKGINSHAKVCMAPHSFDTLNWSVLPNRRGQDVIELWFKGCDEMKFRLRAPKSGASPHQVTWSNRNVDDYFPSGTRYQIDYTRYHEDNGDSRLLITIDRGHATFIEDGRPSNPNESDTPWTLEIESCDVRSPGEIHAWVERKDKRPTFVNHWSDEITLSIPGTARTVISVGSTSVLTSGVSTYSSYGPTRDGRDKPDLAAPGENITAAKGNSLVDIRTDSGTSFSAPHVTGAIALLFSHWEKKRSKIPDWKQLNAAQIRAALSQMTKSYNGFWNSGMGFGILDIEKLFTAFP